MPTGITSLSFTPSLILALPLLLASSYDQRQNMTAQKRTSMLQELVSTFVEKMNSTQQYLSILLDCV
jgi:hypothetical protein